MSSEPTRALRRERRAAAVAVRRSQSRANRAEQRAPRRFGLGSITVVAVLAGLALIGLILVLNAPPSLDPPVVRAASAPADIPAAGLVLGKADAPVTVDLYEDFQCPACQSWGQNVFPSLVANEISDGAVKVVFHGFAFLGPESEAAGRAAWAADRQGRFWDMWATLYANQGHQENGGAFSTVQLRSMAAAIGLEAGAFSADLDSAAARAGVRQGVADAMHAGVDSTPTLLIDGQPVAGGTYPDLAAAIAAAVPSPTP